MSGPKRGNPYISPYNKPDNYIFPETPLSENTQPESPLTKVTNDEGARDVYNNPSLNNGENRAFGTGQVQDKLALGSELDPATFENPLAGGFYQTGPSYCDTCNKTVFASELALPTHLGHQLRYGDEQVNEDIDLIHKTGGDYRIDSEKRNNPSNPSCMDYPDGYVTKPTIQSDPGEKEGPDVFRGQEKDLSNKPLSSRGNSDTLGNSNKAGIESVPRADYSWRAAPMEGLDFEAIIPDEGMRGDNIENSPRISENMSILDDDDRTVAM
jgi:hypothetical protein